MLTKKPISRSVALLVRPATGTPMTTSVWPDHRAKIVASTA
jgi:hypothetical protein